MQAEYARAYENLYRNHWWWRAREDYLISVLRGRLPENGTGRILDVGCGSGLLFERLESFGEVCGVETDVSLRTGIGAVDDRIHWGPLEELAAPARFTCILMLDVLEHMTDPIAALRQAHARLEARGILLATVPAFQMLWTKHDDMNQHVRRYSKRTFRPLLARAGFRAEQLRYFFHWTFAAKLLVRATESVGRGSSLDSVIPSIPAAPLNHALYAFSRLEQWCFRPLPLPFGSSLLVVAVPDR
jgi:2-polyprenyl-3-methyl-5-hydroxy-6-metoxy-1,4-benzoquinol methylase